MELSNWLVIGRPNWLTSIRPNYFWLEGLEPFQGKNAGRES